MFEIASGKIKSAKKVVIYGVEGIGKTKFAAMFPNALFIDTEGSSNGYDVKRLPAPSSFEMLMNEVNYIESNPTLCQTLVVDTADWAERLCIQSVLNKNNWNGIEDPGYGAGYRYVYEEFGKLLNALTNVWEKGVNVVLTAHALVRKFEQPDEMGAYDRWELKLQNTPKCSIAAMVKEWGDMVLFANFKTYAVAVDKDGKKFKGQGGQRVMYTTHSPCWDAKNRDNLPDEMPFDYSGISHLFETNAVTTQNVKDSVVSDNVERFVPVPGEMAIPSQKNEQPIAPTVQPTTQDLDTGLNIPDNIPKPLQDLMRANKVSEEEIRSAVAQKGYFPEDMPIADYPSDFVNGVLIGAWSSVHQMIKEMNINGVPF